jgi:steroid delta-isomerase
MQTSDIYARYVSLIGRLNPDNIGELVELTTPDVHFRDPFNETRGRAAYAHVLAHMFVILQDIRFDVQSQATGTDTQRHFFDWTFTARHSALGSFRVEGVTRIDLAADGRIAAHIDYWDSDSAFLARIPVVGVLMRALRKQMTIRIPE